MTSMQATHLGAGGARTGAAGRPGSVETCLLPPLRPGDDPEWQAGIEFTGTLTRLGRASGPLALEWLHAALAEGGVSAASGDEGESASLATAADLIVGSAPTEGDATAALAAATRALAAGQTGRAAAESLRAAADPALRPAALHVLAGALVASGRARDGLTLAEVLLAGGLRHPAASALAGWAAGQLGDEALTRRHMARAARAARTRAEHRAVLRFAQRILLIQSFGT